MIDFVYTTGKNIGTVNKSKLGEFISLSANATKNLADKHPKRFDCLYLGAFCKANDIKKEDLVKILKKDGRI